MRIGSSGATRTWQGQREWGVLNKHIRGSARGKRMLTDGDIEKRKCPFEEMHLERSRGRGDRDCAERTTKQDGESCRRCAVVERRRMRRERHCLLREVDGLAGERRERVVEKIGVTVLCPSVTRRCRWGVRGGGEEECTTAKCEGPVTQTHPETDGGGACVCV